MKKSIIIFVTTTIFAVGILIFVWSFVGGKTCEAVLTEETLMGNKDAAAGLTVGFTEETKGEVNWENRFNYSTGQTESVIQREQVKDEEEKLTNEIRFTGESSVPYFTQVAYGRALTAWQSKKIQGYYDEIQHRVMETGETEIGKIKVQDYIDYYPISFRFQFGEKIYNMDDALTGLKVLEERGILDEERGSGYNREVELYNVLRDTFKIPVLDNEYQEYKVSKIEKYNSEKELGYKTVVENPLGEGEDMYRFNPILTYQNEPMNDDTKWEHPDLAGEKSAKEKIKNRILFIVNNRTEKGQPVDLSQIKEGYGVYALPIDILKYSAKPVTRWVITTPDPQPVPGQMQMVYPLDAEAAYIEISLSKDHRYLAVFSEKDGDCFVEIIDADYWTSNGAVRIFPAAGKIIYTWGDDGSLAVTDGKGHIAVFERTATKSKPYSLLFRGKTEKEFNDIFFGSGLAVAAKDGKAALAQNLVAGNGKLGIRNPALACAVIDKTGIRYMGTLKSNLVDLDYDMEAENIDRAQELFSQDAENEGGSAAAQKHVIRSDESENWLKWGD